MSQDWRCSQGHEWQAPENAPAGVCPVCGSVAETLSISTPRDSWHEPDSTMPLAGPPSSRHSPPPDIEGYEILGELGRGGMGVVYKARQTKLNRIVALKAILAGQHAGPDELARFRSEAEAVARLHHPNIVQIYEVNDKEKCPYFSLEFVDGQSLLQRLGGNPMGAREAAQVVETLARAMHAAHERGIVHRDLKPGNILVARDGTPKITDFGLAKHLEKPLGQTRSGAVIGTPSYMAPEQAAGKSDQISPLTDVYALGAILYELVTGRPPFRAATALDTVQLVVSEEPVPPCRLQPKLHRDLETICLKCLQKEPRKRYASSASLADDLRRFLNNEPIRARPVTNAERLSRWCRRNPAVACLTAAVATLLIAVAVAATLYALSERNARLAMLRIEEAEERGRKLEKEKADLEKKLLEERRPAGPAGLFQPPESSAQIAKRRAKVEEHLSAGEMEKAIESVNQGHFAEREKKNLLEDIREAMLAQVRKEFSQKRYQRVKDQTGLLLKWFPGDPEGSKLQQEADRLLAATVAAKNGSVGSFITKAAKETDPARKLKLAEEIVSLDDKRVEGYLFKAQAQFALADVADPGVGGADSTLKLAKSLAPAGETESAIAKLEAEIDDRRARIVFVGRAAELHSLIKKTVGEDKQPDFNALLKDAEEAAQKLRSGLARAFYAECLIEAKGSALTAEERKKAETAVEDVKVPSFPGYENYVRGLVLNAGKDQLKAADEMASAYWQPAPAPLRSPHRVKRAAHILEQAALTYKLDGEFANRPLQTLDPVPAEMILKAHQMHRWLTILRELMAPNPLSKEFQVNLALASFYAPGRRYDLQLAGDLLKEPEKLGPLAYTLALHRAKFQDAKAPAEAIKSYLELFDQVRRQTSGPVTFNDLNAAVVLPATRLGESLVPDNPDAITQARPETKQQLARFHAEVAKLLTDEPARLLAESVRANRAQLVFNNYDRAVKLDDKQPDYLVKRGYARCELPQPDLEAARKDGQDAADLNPKSAAGHGLVGHAELLRSRNENDPKARVPILQTAIDSLTAALNNAAKSDPERPTLLTTRSMAYLELANYGRSNLEFSLARAEQDARDAMSYSLRSNPEHALSARANALGDQAWLAGQGDKWEAAVRAFDRAIQLQPERARPWIDRGRCQYKWVAFGGKEPGALKVALSDLQEAGRRGPNPQEQAEMYYWQALIHQQMEEFTSAELNLKKAVDVAQANKLSQSPLYQLAWADLALAEAATRLRAKPDDAAAHSRLGDARERARKVKQQTLYGKDPLDTVRATYQYEAYYALDDAQQRQERNPADPQIERSLAVAEKCTKELEDLNRKVIAALFRGRVLEVRGKWEEALKTYSSALPARLEDLQPEHVELITTRVDFYIAQKTQDLFDNNPKLKPSRDEIMRQADRAVALAFGDGVRSLLDHLEKRLTEADQLSPNLTKAQESLTKAKAALAAASDAERAARQREADDAAAEVRVLQSALERVEGNALVIASLLQRPGEKASVDELTTISERIAADEMIGIRYDPALRKRLTGLMQKIRTQIPNRAVAAAPSATERADERILLGKARAAAGMARFHAMLQPGLAQDKRTAYQTASIDLLREAIRLAPNSPASWVWRVVFAQQILPYYNEYKASKKPEDIAWSNKRHQEADEALRRAAEMAPANYRGQIENLRSRFK